MTAREQGPGEQHGPARRRSGFRRRSGSPRLTPSRMMIAVLHGYQRYVSPALPPTCRFHPTCSAYAVEALQVHGALRGSWLTLRRLLRCAPWHPGGIDLVPPARDDRSAQHHHEEQAPC